MNQTNKMKLGDLLIKDGLLTPEQLNQALAVQQSQKVYKPLGEICVELNFLSRSQLNKALNKHHKRIRIGDLLINLGLITSEQLQTALEHQKREGGKLGEILIKLGFITETSLINTLTIQLGVPKIIPDVQLIDKNLLAGISKEFLMKNEVLPAFKDQDVVTVIMSNPLDEETIRTLGHIFKCSIEPAIAPSKEIKKVIQEYFKKTTFEVPSVFQETKKDLVIGDTDFTQDSEDHEDNIISILDYIITRAVFEGASDIHIEPREKKLRIRYRIDGILRHKTDLPATLAPKLSSRIKAICGLDIAEKRKHQDGRIEARVKNKEVDLRISVFPSVYGENVVIRILHRQSELIDLDSLGLSPVNRMMFQQILDQPAGIILATGPTGSGKTTTLYAALNYLNDGEKAIVTVEDPVEYTIEGVVQGQLDPKLGHTYVDFLKSMMRQDPDVIMVGEIRDAAAASAVIQAALTGHKVLSTFHTDDTTGALLRLMDMGIDTFLISSTVVSVIAQRLVRRLCPHCRERQRPDKSLLTSFNIGEIDLDKFKFYQPVGCPRCANTGFKGRTAIHELLAVNDAIRDAILERKTSTQIRLIARKKANLISMREDGFYKASKGITSLEEILRVVFYNESDELNPRLAEEIIALCENVSEFDLNQSLTVRAPEKVPVKDDEGLVSTNNSDISNLEGEVYRIRFDVTSIEVETDRIADLFNVYQEIMDKTGRTLDDDLLDDFVDFIIYSTKRAEILLKAEFVEFSVRVKDNKPKIVLETLIPASPLHFTPTLSKGNSLHQINLLMPSSGIKKALSTESDFMANGLYHRQRPSLIEFLKQPSPSQRIQNQNNHEPPTPKGFQLYNKFEEELEWKNYKAG